MNTGATVLLYNFTPKRRSQVIPLCVRYGIHVRSVSKEEYGQKLGALCRADGYELSDEMYDGDGFEDEMMVLFGFTRQLLNTFLNDFRRRRVPSVALKAVVTEHNREWDSVRLHREISSEHEAMHSKNNSQKATDT